MQLKKEFIELSNHFNKNINEDKLLFIGMFLNFYLTETNFSNFFKSLATCFCFFSGNEVKSS